MCSLGNKKYIVMAFIVFRIKFIDLNVLRFFTVTCPHVQLPNGQVTSSSSPVNGQYPFNAMISFSCDLGYTLNTTGSNPSITCLDTGDWSHSIPRCNLGNVIIYC